MLFLDTEFNGFGGELISMAVVPYDGTPPWYEVTELPRLIDPWVKQHVIPVLDKDLMRPLLFRLSFQQYIQQFKNPSVICDWHADAAHFCNMMAGANYGTSLDFAFRIEVLKTPPGQPISLKPHNALADATALKEWYKWVQ